jgi:hypothetical protein
MIMLVFVCGFSSGREEQFQQFGCGPEKSNGACKVREDPSQALIKLIGECSLDSCAWIQEYINKTMTAVVTLLNQIDLILLQKNSKACRSS